MRKMIRYLILPVKRRFEKDFWAGGQQRLSPESCGGLVWGGN